MRNMIYIFLFLFLAVSCEVEPIIIPDEVNSDLITHELVGEWSYQREVVTMFSYPISDTHGSIILKPDKSGDWRKTLAFDDNFIFYWKIENGEQNVIIYKVFGSDIKYDMVQISEDNFTFSRKFVIDGLNPVLNDHVEILTLTRK